MKTIKQIFLGSISILVIGISIWIVLFLNPSLSYAKQTQIGNVTIFHNQNLETGAHTVIKKAAESVRKSELFDENLQIQLCLNDDKIYPNLQPFVKYALAFAVLDKTIIKSCDVKFDENLAETKWPINNYEFRKFDLTYLLAHEFTHNLQYEAGYMPLDPRVIIDWKLEGYADYIAREYVDDGKLRDRIEKYLSEENKEHVGLPVFDLEDDTKQILSYFKFSLVVQYLIEVKNLSFDQIYKLESSIEKPYLEMIEWSKK